MIKTPSSHNTYCLCTTSNNTRVASSSALSGHPSSSSSILMGFSTINQPFWGSPICGHPYSMLGFHWKRLQSLLREVWRCRLPEPRHHGAEIPGVAGFHPKEGNSPMSPISKKGRHFLHCTRSLYAVQHLSDKGSPGQKGKGLQKSCG